MALLRLRLVHVIVQAVLVFGSGSFWVKLEKDERGNAMRGDRTENHRQENLRSQRVSARTSEIFREVPFISQSSSPVYLGGFRISRRRSRRRFFLCETLGPVALSGVALLIFQQKDFLKVFSPVFWKSVPNKYSGKRL